MKAGRAPKQKGYQGEVEFMNVLNKFSDHQWYRVVGSGCGNEAADLFAHGVPLRWEVKRIASFPFHQLFENNCPIMDAWIKQAKAAEARARVPVFIAFRPDRGQWYIAGKMKRAYLTGNYLRYWDYEIVHCREVLKDDWGFVDQPAVN